MPNETEKLTINLGVVELAQIDVLVEQGIYSNRSDFIRTAIRKNLDIHKERFDQPITPVSSKAEWTKTVGILTLTRKTLEKLAQNHERLNISIIGMLIIDSSITPELFEKTVDTVIFRGKLVASDEIKNIINKMN